MKRRLQECKNYNLGVFLRRRPIFAKRDGLLKKTLKLKQPNLVLRSHIYIRNGLQVQVQVPQTNKRQVMTSENCLILHLPFLEPFFFPDTKWNVKQVPLPSVDFQKGKIKQNNNHKKKPGHVQSHEKVQFWINISNSLGTSFKLKPLFYFWESLGFFLYFLSSFLPPSCHCHTPMSFPRAEQATSVSARVEPSEGGVMESENDILGSFSKDGCLKLTLIATCAGLQRSHPSPSPVVSLAG